jgi:molecular chaperone GrpE
MTPQDQHDSKAKKMSLEEDQQSAEAMQPEDSHQDCAKQIAELQEKLRKAEEDERRAYADYQNVTRRAQEERSKIVKLAAKDVVLALLLPLDHLNLAKEQLKDHGLTMVYQQFQQALLGQGVQEIDAMGQPFDEQKMEVIDKRPVTDPLQENVVIGVTQRGYTLHGEVIRHARVVIGVASEK